MAVYEGVYKSLLQGVSQQTPQERTDGQLGEQLNMLSDPVTGLRRRGGVRFIDKLNVASESYIEVIEVGTKYKAVIINTANGSVIVVDDIINPNSTRIGYSTPYVLTVRGKTSIRTVVLQDTLYVVNTERTPTRTSNNTYSNKNPNHWGYFSVRASQFSMKFSVRISYGTLDIIHHAVAGDSTANTATPEYIATRLVDSIRGHAPSNAVLDVYQIGSTVAVQVKDKSTTGVLSIEPLVTGGYVLASGVSRVTSRSELLGTLPDNLDGYIMAVGSVANSAYYKYSATTKTWSETGAYSADYTDRDMPIGVVLKEDYSTLKSLVVSPRIAGDATNNPDPSFFGYGITGIAAYQSRLVILSGAYVCMSRTNDFKQFMRTSVTELLDDDAIEVSSSSLSSAQFEYAIPYNRDLVLISQQQQAVIPANSTVLTPKTAVIYPSTTLDISLAVKPTIVGRTMYYTYQRGVDYYQVGEFIPNTYTESQYYSQNLTDHLPLYAKGVCTSLTTSTTSNMVVMCSNSTEVLVNQFLWVGDERPLMSFHKWVFPLPVVHAHFIRDYLVLFMQSGSGVVVGTLNVQFNQLDTKPIPYLDLYTYSDINNGSGAINTKVLGTGVLNLPFATVIYDEGKQRHKYVQSAISADRILCPYTGRVALGYAYKSSFTLTPPFIKDDTGKVIAGTRTTLQQLRMTFKDTGYFNVKVQDTMGVAYSGTNDTALTWSEADLGYSWVNSIGAVTIPCRTRLSSTECTVSSNGTTDMNLVSTEYVLRMASKRKRL